MDQVYPYLTATIKNPDPEAEDHMENRVVIQPRTGCAGILELYVAEGGEKVFLFKGNLNEDECIDLMQGNASSTKVGFDLSANGNHPAIMEVEANMGEFTLYSPNGEIPGHVRITELLTPAACNCKH
jgi:hypothetical protein